jgi:hypothetical protein
VGDGLHSAIIEATRPTDVESSSSVVAQVGRIMLPMASDPGCC